MALMTADRVREFSSTNGTGSLTLIGAAVGYQTFTAAIGVGNTCYYAISNPGVDEWEVGLGTVNAGNVLARTTVLASSNSGNLVVFTTGTKDVFVTYPAEFAAFQGSDASFAGVNVSSLTDSGLTSGRVVLAGTAGLLQDSGSLTFNGSTLAITGALTATADSTFSSTGALTISKGTTGEQPGSPVTGMLRYNTTTNEFEGYSGASPTWKSVGGSAITNDTTTSSFIYPALLNTTTGTALNMYTSNANLLYKPSTGELQANILTANTPFINNASTASADYTIPTNHNALSAGPVTVDTGVTVTVPDGSAWVIV